MIATLYSVDFENENITSIKDQLTSSSSHNFSSALKDVLSGLSFLLESIALQKLQSNATLDSECQTEISN